LIAQLTQGDTSMKSIIEEASSITKAIEKGWHKAGKPTEFSVKIFEEPQRNFIGMTIKSAKIGIFFNDNPQPKQPTPQKNKPQQPQRPAHKEKPVQARREVAPQNTQKAPAHHKEKFTRQPENQDAAISHASAAALASQPVWTETMIEDIQIWLREALAYISVRPLNFTVEAQHFYLKINFSEPIFEDKNREKQLFSSLSVLLLQLLKNKNRRPLKGYKIILVS
jgi:hypothetical protein